MANVLLPLIYAFLTIGKTIDLRDYASIADHRIRSLFSEDDVVETQVNDFNSTYYVLPDEKIPYSKIGMPIDLVLSDKPGEIYGTFIDGSYKGLSSEFSAATILLATEYRKIEQSIKENVTPFSGWQNYNRFMEKHTHYVDKLHYGGRCITTINIRSTVSGDVQIIRRILRDVMGASGSIGKDTVDLWKKAFKAIKESEDVRGEVTVPYGKMCVNVELPSDIYNNVETLLERLTEFPKYVTLRDLHGPLYQSPIYVTFKPLHDLDERFDTVEKNVLTERYLVKLQAMYDDVGKAYGQLDFLFNKIPVEDEEGYIKANELFYNKLMVAKHAVGPLTYPPISIYEDINVTEFNNAFETYYRGLDNSTENYCTVYKKVYEELAVTCEDVFHRPVKGSLLVEKNEVERKANTNLSECQRQCLENKRCRAVEYTEIEGQCLIHYRSTNSAKIIFPQDSSAHGKVYDRKCDI